MLGHIYNLKATIFSLKNYKEKDKLAVCFTEEFGLINVLVVGGRLEKSKIRNLLRENYHYQLSIFKGRNHWRLIGALPLKDFKNDLNLINLDSKSAVLPVPIKKIRILSRLQIVLIHLISFNTPVPELFNCWDFIRKLVIYYVDYDTEAELLSLVLILKNLGYIPEDKILNEISDLHQEIVARNSQNLFLEDDSINRIKKNLYAISKNKASFLKIVNEALNSATS